MLRFASSPTTDMHIGDLRVALFNYLLAQQRGENFIVRIDDSDRERNIEGKDQEILDLLGLFKIEYTQVIHQSQNFKFHSAMALQLLHEKKAFSCFCSDEWLEKKRQEAEEKNKPYRYDDACRNLPAELVIDNTAPFTVRITRPDKDITIDDMIEGKLTFTPDEIDSFVIMNQDKTPTYNFACAVDDMLNDISVVVCDKKHISSTPKQVHIRNQLGYEKEIKYAHIPPIINEESISVKSLLKEGYLPEAILNYLILMANKTPREIFTLDEAKEFFTLETIAASSVEFNMDTLKDINKKHMQIMDATELSRYVGFADAEIGELARIYLQEAGTTRELKEKITPIFAPREIPDSWRDKVTMMKKIIIEAPYFDAYADFKAYVIKETGFNEKDFEIPLRLLLTNAQKGPDIADIYKYLKNYIGEIIK
jgi:glutamyl-tRNA synthetase